MKSFVLKPWQVALAVVALIALFVVPLFLARNAEFDGTDSAVVEVIEKEHGVEAWFKPLFEPAPEVESGLFAMQAGLGAGILGFALGRLSSSKRSSGEASLSERS